MYTGVGKVSTNFAAAKKKTVKLEAIFLQQKNGQVSSKFGTKFQLAQKILLTKNKFSASTKTSASTKFAAGTKISASTKFAADTKNSASTKISASAKFAAGTKISASTNNFAQQKICCWHKSSC